MSIPIISVQKLSFYYNNSEIPALSELSFDVERGDFVLLCGPTGSGKTTLLRALNGLIPHFYGGKYFGYLFVEGKDVLEEGPSKISQFIGTVFQNPENQLFSMNVERELAFGLEQIGLEKSLILKRINDVFKLIGIEHLRDRSPFELSGGEQQKVAIASILALDPPILILDEPLANLDPSSAKEIVSLLTQLNQKQEKTIIISEHRMEYLLPFVKKVLVVKEGKLWKYKTVKEIINDSDFFTMGLDLNPLLYWFNTYKRKGYYLSLLPLTKNEMEDAFFQFFSSLPTEKLGRIRDLLSSYPIYKTSVMASYQDRSSEVIPIIIDDLSFTYKDYVSRPSITNESDEILQSIHFMRKQTLENISLSILRGEVIGIVGPNGAGKSTLIKTLNGLRLPQKGNVWIVNNNTRQTPIHKLTRLVGLCFQNPDHQLFSNKVRDELLFSLKNLDLPRNRIEQRIDKICEKLNLCDFLDRSPFNLSGGQRKKVALATILCRETEIVIFDEPTVGQDAHEKQELSRLIHELSQEGKTILIISHDIDFLIQVSDRLIGLYEGKLLVDGFFGTIFKHSFLVEALSLQLPSYLQIIRSLIEKNKEKNSQWSSFFEDLEQKAPKLTILEEILEKCL